jgi:Zn-dependent peptidase ImmA (M78 family)/DNA-binding transcriptional regulator YiaG
MADLGQTNNHRDPQLKKTKEKELMTARTPNFEPARLKRARLCSRLTQSELAEEIGRSSNMIAKYEQGSSTPSPQTISKLVQALGYPEHYFVTPVSKYIDESTPVFWRKLTSARKKEQRRCQVMVDRSIEAYEYLSLHLDLPHRNLPDFGIESPLGLSLGEVESLAGEAREFWNLGQRPIGNMVWLLENNGVVVTQQEFDNGRIDGFSTFPEKDHAYPVVVLSSNETTAARTRYNAAHELAHLLLHRKISTKDINKKSVHKQLEEQANRFAGAFLLPESSFAQSVSHCSLEEFRLNKSRWKVAISAQIMRCHDLGWIDDERKRQLFVKMSQRGWRGDEPLDDQLKEENPDLLSRSFTVLLRDAAIPKEEVLHSLPYGAERIESLVETQRGALKESTSNAAAIITPKGSSETDHAGNNSGYQDDSKVIDFPKSV